MGLATFFPASGGRAAVHRLEQAQPAGMDVARGGHAQAALQAGGEVGDDVAEHVRGDDHLELPRVAHELQGQVVDVEVARLDLRDTRPPPP